jgi:hypothetical protein
MQRSPVARSIVANVTQFSFREIIPKFAPLMVGVPLPGPYVLAPRPESAMPPTLRSNPLFPPMGTGRCAAIVRRTLIVTVVLPAAWAIGHLECRADDAIDAFAPGVRSSSDGCDRYDSSDTAAAHSEAGSHEPSPASPDGGIAAGIPVWKTIALGTPASIRALRADLNRGCRVGGLAGEVLDQLAVTAGKTRIWVDLVLLSAAELGFAREGAPLGAIYERARQLGLALCPAEVGPQLRLQYTDQPPGEFLHVAMYPVATPNAGHAAFVVGNGDGGLLLIGSDSRLDRIVPSTMRFVFLRPQ